MSLFTRTDVTCVKLYKNVILSGIGSFIHVYDLQTSKLIQKIRVLNRQNIYGIVPSKCTLKSVIFGGKQFTVITESECIFSCEFEAVVSDDWIHSGIWLTDNKIALLSAHNVVTVWDIKTESVLSQYISKDNSILYSGLLLPLHNEILIFSGTVFSQVILHWCGDHQPLHYLKGHKGVIFSITCNPDKGVIVSTSDDRSVRIWAVVSVHLDYNSRSYWANAKIHCIHDLYGHTARVMRNCLTNNYIISVGEDSAICFWDYNGKLLKKSISHQNASIWCLDADEIQLVTGGGDCGVTLHPLSLVSDYGHHQIIDIDVIPKKVMFTARRNIVIAKDENNLTYFDIDSKRTDKINLNHNTYQLVCLSFCKQLLAVVDMKGKLDIFIENCKGDPELKKIIDTQLDIGRILSMQWAGNRHLVFCSEDGLITFVASKENNIEIIDNFVLPSCKERWLTSSALSDNRQVLVVSDRCGHVHIYSRGNKKPVITFKKVHGRYGATSIQIKNNVVTTTGRDGTVKYFSIRHTNDVKYTSCKDLEFQWVEKFLDVNENYICGFRERTFVVYDITNNVKNLHVDCGGGHRSWDAVRYFDSDNGNFEEYIRLMYLKNSIIHLSTFCLNRIVSKNIVHGTHSKEINCLKTYCDADKSVTWYISGGEDTTLRVSRSSPDLDFRDEVIFKHLSNVRSLRILPLGDKKVLVVSAGGRAQICVKVMTFKAHSKNNLTSEVLVNYLIKGTDRERKGNQNWKNCSVDFDPETRIMDVEVLAMSNSNVGLFAACSDAILRIFNLNTLDGEIQMLREIDYHKTCILKTRIFTFLNKEILVTCTTRGEIAFWEVGHLEKFKNEPIFITKANKSGINSLDIKAISDSQFLLATGGDDNAIHLKIIEADNKNVESMKVLHSLVADRFHCSQITGLVLVDRSCVTTSIDQRVTSFSWDVTEDGIRIAFVDQKHSDIADIHGMDVVNSLGEFITVCVYGKGLEVIQISKK